MRILVVIGMMLALAACGASDKQVMAAKTAQYSGTPSQLLDIAMQVAQETYKIGDVDGPVHRFVTAPQFYSAEGGRQSVGADGFVTVSPGSVELQMLVEVVQAEGGKHVVVVTPVTQQMVEGSPKPRALAPDDPNLPGWVRGRVDELQVRIYDAAKPLLAAP